MSASFILIPGRTGKQGSGISEGKFDESYQSETHTLLFAQDMKPLGLGDGDRVRMTSPHGQVEVAVAAAKGDELPPRLAVHRLRRPVQPLDGRRYARFGNAHQQGTGCGTGEDDQSSRMATDANDSDN